MTHGPARAHMRPRDKFFFESHTWPEVDPFDLSKNMAELAGTKPPEPTCTACPVSAGEGRYNLCTTTEVTADTKFIERENGHYILTLLAEPGYPANCTRCGVGREMCFIAPCAQVEAAKNSIEAEVYLRVIYHNDHSDMIPVPAGEGWKIDACRRLLIVGKGIGRVMVPLENIRHFGPVKN